MRIMIADDDSGTLTALKAGLISEGHEVITVGDGDLALKVITEESKKGMPLHLIITDLRMPGLNGLELIRGARKFFPFIPAILMTAHGNQSVKSAVTTISGCVYLEKPFTTETVRKLILNKEKNKVI